LPFLGRQRWYGDTCEDHRQAVGGSTGLEKCCRRLFAGVNLTSGIGFMLPDGVHLGKIGLSLATRRIVKPAFRAAANRYLKNAGNPRRIRAHLAAEILVENGPTLNSRL